MCLSYTTMSLQPLKQTLQCHCGQVRFAVESPSVLRLVCYCKDCRGYYNTLNKNSIAHNKQPVATLDPWGGVDYIQLYPKELTFEKGGEDHATVCLIRPTSKIRRVYATCCNTPLFQIGEMGALLNTHLVVDTNARPVVRFRIIGRNAYKKATDLGNEEAALEDNSELKRPPMSWSVPMSWFWVMIRRVKNDLMTPTPLKLEDAKVLADFEQG
jgi:hypothetical protein